MHAWDPPSHPFVLLRHKQTYYIIINHPSLVMIISNFRYFEFVPVAKFLPPTLYQCCVCALASIFLVQTLFSASSPSSSLPSKAISVTLITIVRRAEERPAAGLKKKRKKVSKLPLLLARSTTNLPQGWLFAGNRI